MWLVRKCYRKVVGNNRNRSSNIVHCGVVPYDKKYRSNPNDATKAIQFNHYRQPAFKVVIREMHLSKYLIYLRTLYEIYI